MAHFSQPKKDFGPLFLLSPFSWCRSRNTNLAAFHLLLVNSGDFPDPDIDMLLIRQRRARQPSVFKAVTRIPVLTEASPQRIDISGRSPRPGDDAP